MSKGLINDFNKDALIQKVVSHAENLTHMSERINVLEGKIGDNIRFAQTFQDASMEAKKIEETLVDVLLSLLNSNQKARSSISKIVDELDRAYFTRLVKKLGWGFWTIFVLVLGAILDRVVTAFPWK